MRRQLTLAFLVLGTCSLFQAAKETIAKASILQSTGPPVTKDSGSSLQTSPSAPPAKVDFQDNQPLSMWWSTGTVYRVSFFLHNDETTDATVSFATVLADYKNHAVSLQPRIVSGSVVPRNAIGQVAIEIDVGKTDMPLSGYLEMTAKADSGRQYGYQYKALKIPPPLPSALAECLSVASLIASIAVVIVSLVWLRVKGVKIMQRMGPPAWEFSDSWGTNITIGGALLTSVLGFGALPEQTHYLNKTGYLDLSLIFAALIAVAPAIYALLRTPVAVVGSSTLQYQGYVLFFALASGVTVWGAIGQIETVGLLFCELGDVGQISHAVLFSLLTILCCVIALLLVYGCRTIYQIASIQHSITEARGASASGHLPSWPVL
jgi:hypothetical protein